MLSGRRKKLENWRKLRIFMLDTGPNPFGAFFSCTIIKICCAWARLDSYSLVKFTRAHTRTSYALPYTPRCKKWLILPKIAQNARAGPGRSTIPLFLSIFDLIFGFYGSKNVIWQYCYPLLLWDRQNN